jgi:hypothetical protein
MCEVAGFSRSGYYRFLDPAKPALADMDLRDEIQKIALEWPSYESQRITAELKARQGDVNRKRVQRIMREDNLWCVVKPAQANTTRARKARAWAEVGRRAHRSSVSCSPAVKINSGVGRPSRIGILLVVIPMHAECHLFILLMTQDASLTACGESLRRSLLRDLVYETFSK